jgi:hypothetical protein
MEGLLLTIAVLACPIGMGVMMLLMMRGRHRYPTEGEPPGPSAQEELAELRAEVERLKADRSRRQANGGDL